MFAFFNYTLTIKNLTNLTYYRAHIRALNGFFARRLIVKMARNSRLLFKGDKYQIATVRGFYPLYLSGCDSLDNLNYSRVYISRKNGK